MLEHGIQQQIFLTLGSLKDVRVFRNNVGVAYSGQELKDYSLLSRIKNLFLSPVRFIVLLNHRVIKYGLQVGSGDLIGWKSIEITPDMVGQKVAVFLSVEIKSNKGKATEEQINWAQVVRASGGIAGIVRSTSEAISLVN
jgi:hypothetical protein